MFLLSGWPAILCGRMKVLRKRSRMYLFPAHRSPVGATKYQTAYGQSHRLFSECQRTPKPAKTICRFGVFFDCLEVPVTGWSTEAKVQKRLAQQAFFALLRNLPATVSTYADACKLLVFGASLTSVSLSKNSFLTDCKQPMAKAIGCFLYGLQFFFQ